MFKCPHRHLLIQIPRCTDEKLACKIKEKEISQISETLETKKKEEQNISITLNENRRFHVFLKRVVEEGTFDNFSEIQDILDRYRTLKSTNDDLMAQMQKNTEQHEERRSSYMHFMKFGSNEMLRKNNEIVGLQKEMEKVTMMHNNIENLNDGTNRNAIEMTTDISQILVVIGNLAERLKSRAHPSQRRKENAKKDFASRSFIEEDDPTVAIEMKKKKAMTNLEIITDYIVDYQNIAHGWQLMRGVTAEL
jgi:hypothetical protein